MSFHSRNGKPVACGRGAALEFGRGCSGFLCFAFGYHKTAWQQETSPKGLVKCGQSSPEEGLSPLLSYSTSCLHTGREQCSFLHLISLSLLCGKSVQCSVPLNECPMLNVVIFCHDVASLLRAHTRSIPCPFLWLCPSWSVATLSHLQ